MIYSATRIDQPEMLADGEYKGFHFYVLNLGTHPCAYVDVTDTELNGKDYGSIDAEIVNECKQVIDQITNADPTEKGGEGE